MAIRAVAGASRNMDKSCCVFTMIFKIGGKGTIISLQFKNGTLFANARHRYQFINKNFEPMKKVLVLGTVLFAVINFCTAQVEKVERKSDADAPRVETQNQVEPQKPAAEIRPAAETRPAAVEIRPAAETRPTPESRSTVEPQRPAQDAAQPKSPSTCDKKERAKTDAQESRKQDSKNNKPTKTTRDATR